MKVNILVLVKSVLKYFEVMEQGVCNFQKKIQKQKIYIYAYLYIQRERRRKEKGAGRVGKNDKTTVAKC